MEREDGKGRVAVREEAPYNGGRIGITNMHIDMDYGLERTSWSLGVVSRQGLPRNGAAGRAKRPSVGNLQGSPFCGWLNPRSVAQDRINSFSIRIRLNSFLAHSRAHCISQAAL